MIKRYVDIHATVFLESGSSAVVPQYVTNHGILSESDLHQLLKQSKVLNTWSSVHSASYYWLIDSYLMLLITTDALKVD